MTKKSDDSGAGGDYDVGYRRPPKSGQIKPGEVRNPWGRTGKRRRPEDLLLKVAAEQIPASVNGRPTSMSQEEGTYRKMFQEALKGNPAAIKLAMEHLSRRRPPLPPLPTADELAQQEADQKQREDLSARLVGLLQAEASRKKSLAPRINCKPDIRPPE